MLCLRRFALGNLLWEIALFIGEYYLHGQNQLHLNGVTEVSM